MEKVLILSSWRTSAASGAEEERHRQKMAEEGGQDSKYEE